MVNDQKTQIHIGLLNNY